MPQSRPTDNPMSIYSMHHTMGNTHPGGDKGDISSVGYQ